MSKTFFGIQSFELKLMGSYILKFSISVTRIFLLEKDPSHRGVLSKKMAEI